MKTKSNPIFWIHPLLFGLYPVLALYVFNRHEIVFPAIQQAVITSLVITAVVIGVFWLVFRSWHRAAIFSTLALLLLFTYGHVFDLVKNLDLFGKPVGHHILLPIWILLFVVLGIILLRLKDTLILNRMLNLISIWLVVFLAVQVLSSFFQLQRAEQEFSQKAPPASERSIQGTTDRDVYYIVVDSFSRSDLLQQRLDLEASGFQSELEKLGFYIPDCAQSNYDSTLLSLASSLNMNYLDTLGIDYQAEEAAFRSPIQKSLVMKMFEAMGYNTVSFKSLYPELDIKQSTYYYDYFKDVAVLDSQASLNFQYLFLRTTLVRPLIQLIESNPNIRLPPFLDTWIPAANTLNSRDYRQYQQNIFALEALQNAPALPGKNFVYAHLYVTHQPFVFYPDGRFHPFLPQYYDAYRDQVVFMEQRLLEIVRDIVARSDPDPVIVIQSDHSFFEKADRVKILNAYYLPDGGEGSLYPTVTPVNTFRIIFNRYYEGQYELLPDISRYVDEENVLIDSPMTCIQQISGEEVQP